MNPFSYSRIIKLIRILEKMTKNDEKITRRDFLKKILYGTAFLSSSIAATIMPHQAYVTYITDQITFSKKKNNILGDLHSHSSNSDGIEKPSSMLSYAKRIGLDFILITDHLNEQYPHHCFLKTMKDQATYLDKGGRMNTLPAVEISTAEGHIIAYFEEDYFNTPEKLSVLRYYENAVDTIKRVQDLGGNCIIAHPGIIRKDMKEEYGIDNRRIHLLDCTGIENFSSMNPDVDETIYQLHNLPPIASSDSHMLFDIGSSFTSFEEENNLYKTITSGVRETHIPLFDLMGRDAVSIAINAYLKINNRKVF
jgi:predicted metal-dependent phosphoesterase TrpH